MPNYAIAYLKQFDRDYPFDDKRVVVFSKDDKYRLRGKTHDIRSAYIRYGKGILRNKYNKMARQILRLIKIHQGDIYLLTKGNTIIGGGNSVKQKIKTNREILYNSFDLIHDKDVRGEELLDIERQILDYIDVYIPFYIRQFRKFVSSGIDAGRYDVDSLERFVESKTTISFNRNNNDAFFNFSNGLYAEKTGPKFVTFQRLEFETKNELIEFWKKKRPEINTPSFNQLIDKLRGIDIGGFEIPINQRPQDVRDEVPPSVESPSKPLDPEIKEKVETAIETNLARKKYTPTKKFIVDKEYIVGKDSSGNPAVVVDWDGTYHQYEEFQELANTRNRIEKRMGNIHKVGTYLGTLTKFSDEEVRQLVQTNEIKYEFLTDIKQVQNKLTRSYPTIDYHGRSLIVGGRFRGYFLDDMINRVGRVVAGSAYVIGDDGLPKPMEYKEGELTKFRIENEPYLTMLDTGEFRLILPEWAKDDIKAINKLQKTFKTIQSINKFTFNVSIDDYDLINDALGGVTMSEQAANEVIKMIEYRKKLAKNETNEQYDDITFDQVFNMKKDSRHDFMAHQKKAVKTILNKDGNTVIGLDTGTGKTLTGIGIINNWINDGTLEKDGKNGKFLIVTPASLRGNFPASIRKYCEDADITLSKVDVVSYNEFMKGKDRWKEYGAIIFDEAQQLRTGKSKVSLAALKLDHPRKIPLTASVLEKSPVDLFILVSIARNYYGNPKQFRKMLNDFTNTFCEKVGNKVVGLKSDPEIKRRFREWVKETTLYIDKTEVKEIPLPSITPPEEQTQAVRMPAKVSAKYNELAAPIEDTLQRMVSKYKDGVLQASDINKTLAGVLSNIQTLKNFLNNPDDFVNVPNPKVEIMKQKLENAFQRDDFSKAVIWTDSPALAEKAALGASEAVPFKKHILALANEIRVYKNGQVAEKFNANTNLTDKDGNEIPRKEWQVHLMSGYNKDRDVASFTLTSAYTTGYNLQSANHIIHLDRDTWNNEKMKQRNARAWRTGQVNPVEASIIDLVNDEGTSLDTIQKYSMDIERQLFDELIKGSAEIDAKVSNSVIRDVRELIKNKEAFRYLLNPNIDFSYTIENPSTEP